MARNFFTNGTSPNDFGYTWIKATDVPANKNMDELFKEIYEQANKERKERGYIVDDLSKFNNPKYGVTQPGTI